MCPHRMWVWRAGREDGEDGRATLADAEGRHRVPLRRSRTIRWAPSSSGGRNLTPGTPGTSGIFYEEFEKHLYDAKVVNMEAW